MKRSIPAIAAAMFATMSAAAPASAEFYRIVLNGESFNGKTVNGRTVNGLPTNGIALNGLPSNGVEGPGMAKGHAAPQSAPFDINAVRLVGVTVR